MTTLGPDTIVHGGTTLVVLDASGGVAALDDLRPAADEALRTAGSVLLRGLGVPTAEVFHGVVGGFGEHLTSYRGGNTPRSTVTDGVFTSTEYPAEYAISMHNELSYAHAWPERLFFCCLDAADTGGATPVADGRALLADLDDAVRDRFVERGVTYRQHLHGGFGLGKSWQQTFETDDRDEVEEFLRAADLRFSWTADGDLRAEQTRPAVRAHPATGETAWFNQADQWHPSNLPPAEAAALLAVVESEDELPHSVTYGDGSPLTADDCDAVRAAAARHTVAEPWRVGDVLVVENLLALHGRQPYTGSRRVLVSMT